MFEVFPRDQVLVLPFDYFTTEQFIATNQILRFLNLTEITDPKKILKVYKVFLLVYQKCWSKMYIIESVLRPMVYSSRRPDYAAKDKRITRQGSKK